MKKLINHAKNTHSHLKKHHKNYIIWWFGIYSIAKMLLLLMPFLVGYSIWNIHTPTVAADIWNISAIDYSVVISDKQRSNLSDTENALKNLLEGIRPEGRNDDGNYKTHGSASIKHEISENKTIQELELSDTERSLAHLLEKIRPKDSVDPKDRLHQLINWK